MKEKKVRWWMSGEGEESEGVERLWKTSPCENVALLCG